MSRALMWAMLFASPGVALAADPAPSVPTASMSLDQKLAYAQNAVSEISQSVKGMEQMLEKARASKDAKSVGYLIPRVTAARALLQVSEAAVVAMAEAVESGNVERANHEFRKVSVAITKSRLLLAEAERDGAEPQQVSGKTSMQFQDQLAESEPFEEVQINDLDVSVDPPPVSPFL